MEVFRGTLGTRVCRRLWKVLQVLAIVCWPCCAVALRVVRCAAVLFIDGKFHYTDGVPSKKIMEQFKARNDRLDPVLLSFGVASLCTLCAVRQITTLELLSISIGLSTFQSELQGRKVVVWSDNKGAEGAFTAVSSTTSGCTHSRMARIFGLSACRRTTTSRIHLPEEPMRSWRDYVSWGKVSGKVPV